MVRAKRVATGLVTSVAILIVFDLLPNVVPDKYVSLRMFGYFYAWPGVGGLIAMFVAAFGGAYVSRTHFVIPAILLAAAFWIYLFYLLNAIAGAAGQGEFFVMAGTNAFGLIFGIVGAASGAHVGTTMACWSDDSSKG